MDIEITHDRSEGHGQYQLVADGDRAGELDYRDDAGTRVFTHTGVRPHLEGRGLAAQLVRRGLDDARADGLLVVPACWYVASYLDRHPDDADLRAP